MTTAPASSPAGGRAVAQYLRMSTDRQTYSLEYQAAAHAAYAASRGWSIVKTYSDPGVSGLTLRARPGLQALLSDVLSGAAEYEAVLVYDVSRWGRFQDLDQGAHYEFVCREAGVQIIYTAEPFTDDQSLSSSILKHLKRVMAAEYSRDLSAKTARAQQGLHALGYWIGGAPGYGLRRTMVAPSGETVMQMELGQYKALHGHRTRLVPGPDEEVRTVQRIYRLFAYSGMRHVAIAHLLNSEGTPAEGGGRWSRTRVRTVLTSEKYVGVLVGGKRTVTLGERRTRRPREWVRVPGSLEPLISRTLFDLAQSQARLHRSDRVTDDVLLSELRAILATHGQLSRSLIKSHPAAHSVDYYRKRFGSLQDAYRAVGYEPTLRQRRASEVALRNITSGQFKPCANPPDPIEVWANIVAHYNHLGHISSSTLEIDPLVPSRDRIRKMFGGMGEIYARLGHEPTAGQKLHLAKWERKAQKYRRPS